MIKKANLLFLSLVMMGLFGFAISSTVYADTEADLKAACAQANNEPAYCANLTENKNPIAGEGGIINKITDVIALVAGFTAVIMVIYGGFRYIISNGDAAKITSARQVITYALIGLVVIILARTIIIFVLNRVT